ncbi:hypothetical protein EDB89DRAFT_2188557 [Lactarius sanguifluus]|nr:hypothetical protein EDB89DRAFT_2188557 [Lactarius sanguifluus]
MKLISPVVDVLYTFSGTLGEVAGLAFPLAGVIFTGIGVLLSVAEDVRASHDALVELFEHIENFFMRLGVYTQISLTTEMAGVLVKIMTEVLSILSIATKEVKRKRANLIQEEVRMATAQTMNDAKNANDNIDQMKCSWSATSIACVVNTGTTSSAIIQHIVPTERP